MKAKKYHDLSDNYVLFMVLLVVIVLVLTGANKCENHARDSRIINDTLLNTQ